MKIKISEYLSLISCIGILGWIISDFFGGMNIFLLSYFYIIAPICFLYLLSIIILIVRLIKYGIQKNKINLYTHLSLLLVIILFNLFTSEIFKSKVILAATLKDDLFYYKIKLRENGNCDLECTGMFGYEDTFHGKYKLVNDTIEFQKIPYDTVGFIPEKILIDKTQTAIFIERKENGEFDREKKYLNHFEFDK